MKSYKLVDFGKPLAEVEEDTPAPKGAEVLIRTQAAGVCHSDLHIQEGAYDLGGGKTLSLADRGMVLPLTMGHENAGEIIAVGPDVSDRKVGESCLVYPWIGCGECRSCKDGLENHCMAPNCVGVHRDGGYADHIIVPHERYLLPLEGLDPIATAPYACSGLTTYSALKKLGDEIRRSHIVIIGAGGLGLMCLSILKAIGGKGAVVVDIDESRRAAALDAGAIAAVDGRAGDAVAKITEAVGGMAFGVIDLVGSEDTGALGFNCLAKGGSLVIVGLFGGSTPWSMPLIPMKAARIHGSYTGSLAEMKELLALIRKGNVAEIPFHVRSFGDATTALDDLQNGRYVGRAILTP